MQLTSVKSVIQQIQLVCKLCYSFVSRFLDKGEMQIESNLVHVMLIWCTIWGAGDVDGEW